MFIVHVNSQSVFLVCVILLGLFVNMSRTKSEFSRVEKQAIERLRPIVNSDLIHEYQREDDYLINWLRAYSLNINSAAKALKEAQQWRKTNKIDSILNETILQFSPAPYTIDGVDKMGRPVLAWSASSIDIRKLVLGGKTDKVIRYLLQSSERVYQSARQRFQNGTAPDAKYVSIIDLSGFSRLQHACLACIQVYVDWTRQTEKYYKGVYSHDLWINTPRIALPIVQILTPLMSAESRKAFRAFGTNREEWSSFLLNIIPADQLTFQFGGTKKS